MCFFFFFPACHKYSAFLSARVFKMLIFKNLLYPDTINEFCNTISIF